MKIIFKSKDLEITDTIRSYTEKKISTLEKFLKNFNQEIILAEIELGRTTWHHKSGEIFRAEINLSIDGEVFRAESEQDDLYASIDEVRDDLEQEIKKFKAKRDTIFIRGARSIKKHFRISPLARFKKK